jgi:N-ethylmaleimide reductase
MAHSTLFSPLELGAVTLQHRIAMATLTSMRAGQPGDVPRAMNAEHDRQRATPAGLIVTEATQISRQGQGYS